MTAHASRLELLAPAKNLAYGQAAIDHGADAVYIGGPSFGARSAAGNSIDDIAALAAYAHRFDARVLLALNTILRDDELEPARRLIHQAYDAGVDALIVQDMGLLELNLPPIQLHASTQCDIRTPEKARFLQDVGFSQIVLARELTLAEIARIAEAVDPTRCTLEYFVHGALCVSYSGQCTISHAITGRSANRGDCAQICRLPFTLTEGSGVTESTVAEHRHLLSLKDNDQTAHLSELIDAGIRSFKIEGRLKDLSYVKNVTAHYRTELDHLIDGRRSDTATALSRSSAGNSTLSFEPRPEKTFNRGSTDYFTGGRRDDIGAFDSPKYVGTPIGRARRISGKTFSIDTQEALANGDGLAWYDPQGKLLGARINQVDGGRVSLSEPPEGLLAGTMLYRNLDHEFEKQLAKKSAERRLHVQLRLTDCAEGLGLHAVDETGCATYVEQACAKEAPKDAARAEQTLRSGLAKLGASIYQTRPEAIVLDTAQAWFVASATVNALRRAAVEALDATRATRWQRPPRAPAASPPARYPADTLNYLGNVYNQKARQFYEQHGVRIVEPAFETNQEKGLVSLMVTRHCLRYSFNLCPKQVKGIRPDPMHLHHETADGRGETLILRFDCKPCEMHVMGKLRGKRALILTVK